MIQLNFTKKIIYFLFIIFNIKLICYADNYEMSMIFQQDGDYSVRFQIPPNVWQESENNTFISNMPLVLTVFFRQSNNLVYPTPLRPGETQIRFLLNGHRSEQQKIFIVLQQRPTVDLFFFKNYNKQDGGQVQSVLIDPDMFKLENKQCNHYTIKQDNDKFLLYLYFESDNYGHEEQTNEIGFFPDIDESFSISGNITDCNIDDSVTRHRWRCSLNTIHCRIDSDVVRERNGFIQNATNHQSYQLKINNNPTSSGTPIVFFIDYNTRPRAIIKYNNDGDDRGRYIPLAQNMFFIVKNNDEIEAQYFNVEYFPDRPPEIHLRFEDESQTNAAGTLQDETPETDQAQTSETTQIQTIRDICGIWFEECTLNAEHNIGGTIFGREWTNNNNEIDGRPCGKLITINIHGDEYRYFYYNNSTNSYILYKNSHQNNSSQGRPIHICVNNCDNPSQLGRLILDANFTPTETERFFDLCDPRNFRFANGIHRIVDIENESNSEQAILQLTIERITPSQDQEDHTQDYQPITEQQRHIIQNKIKVLDFKISLSNELKQKRINNRTLLSNSFIKRKVKEALEVHFRDEISIEDYHHDDYQPFSIESIGATLPKLKKDIKHHPLAQLQRMKNREQDCKGFILGNIDEDWTKNAIVFYLHYFLSKDKMITVKEEVPIPDPDNVQISDADIQNAIRSVISRLINIISRLDNRYPTIQKVYEDLIFNKILYASENIEHANTAHIISQRLNVNDMEFQRMLSKSDWQTKFNDQTIYPDESNEVAVLNTIDRIFLVRSENLESNQTVSFYCIPSSHNLSYQDAEEKVYRYNSRNHARRNNWRIPTLDELFHFFQLKKFKEITIGALNELLPNELGRVYFWTSSVKNENSHWVIEVNYHRNTSATVLLPGSNDGWLHKTIDLSFYAMNINEEDAYLIPVCDFSD